MKLLVIESSPHRDGSPNLLAEEFIRGAQESGRQIQAFDAVQADWVPHLAYKSGKSFICLQEETEMKKVLAAYFFAAGVTARDCVACP